MNNVGLVMPSNCVIMDNEEMQYLDGGVNIGMTKNYLNKDTCLYVAAQWVHGSNWKNVTVAQIAHEIYGHAVGYYNWSGVLKAIPDLKGGSFYDHVADGVDINNSVDKYQAAFDVIWKVL